MADVKISGLPASTTPLDGTEVLPIVQGTTTKQVSVANLTAGRAVSASTISVSGISTLTGTVTTVGDVVAGSGSFYVSSAGNGFAQFNSGGTLAWTNGGTANSGTRDVVLVRDAANVLAQRNGTNAQTYNLYNTYTSSTNYEAHSVTWSSNVCYAKNIVGSSGTLRLFIPVTGATTVASLPSASTAGIGARSFVTDALAPSFGIAVTGGGAIKIPVYSDGTSWYVG